MPSSSALRMTNLDLRADYQLPRTIPQLDRLRGLAILLVLICHLWRVLPPALVEIGQLLWIGVDLFFVLSGFLITGILWDARESKGYFGRFYGRRILRIWPAYTLVLLFAFGLVPLLKRFASGMVLGIPTESLGLWAYLLMIQNFFGKALRGSLILAVTWSLAIEEQFYFVWPAVIRFASRRLILPCLLGAILLEPLLRMGAMHWGISEITIYDNPLTHGDGLLCGAAIAAWLRLAKPKRGLLMAMGTVLLVAGLGAFVLFDPYDVTYHYCSPFVFTAVAALSSGLLLIALVSENTGRILHRSFFMNKQLAFLGFISYSLYLYHFFIFQVIENLKLVAKIDQHNPLHFTQPLMVICGVGFSILIAWISRVTVERAALSKKGIFG